MHVQIRSGFQAAPKVEINIRSGRCLAIKRAIKRVTKDSERMLTGKHNPYFLRHQSIRLVATYCLLMAAALSVLALVDYLQTSTLDSISIGGLAALLAAYGGFLLWRDRPFDSSWPEWLVVIALAGWTISGVMEDLLGVHAAYWLPFYLVFAVRWAHAAMAIAVFSALFSMLVLMGDLGARGQILTTYLVSAATALCFGWLNDRGEAHMLAQLGQDPQTRAYTERQLIEDLAKEIPRADRQTSRLLLAVVVIPQLWKTQGREVLEQHLCDVADALRQYALPFHKVYKLDSEDFVVLMPHGKSLDMQMIETRMAPVLGNPDELPMVALHYQPDDDQESLLARIEEAVNDFSR